MSAKFKLGSRVRDKITGIEGVVIGYYFHLNGCQYIDVEPDAKEGVRAESIYLAEERFELISESGDLKEATIADCHVKLGNEVKDNLSGFKGHAVVIQIPLYGVGRIAVEPTTIKDGKMADAIFFDEQRVEVIQPKAPPVAADMPEKRKTRGCAPSRVPSHVLGR